MLTYQRERPLPSREEAVRETERCIILSLACRGRAFDRILGQVDELLLAYTAERATMIRSLRLKFPRAGSGGVEIETVASVCGGYVIVVVVHTHITHTAKFSCD